MARINGPHAPTVARNTRILADVAAGRSLRQAAARAGTTLSVVRGVVKMARLEGADVPSTTRRGREHWSQAEDQQGVFQAQDAAARQALARARVIYADAPAAAALPFNPARALAAGNPPRPVSGMTSPAAACAELGSNV